MVRHQLPPLISRHKTCLRSWHSDAFSPDLQRNTTSPRWLKQGRFLRTRRKGVFRIEGIRRDCEGFPAFSQLYAMALFMILDFTVNPEE
ncbi:hypothetical protein HPP92_010062 [Vanilla planifolia]|uniref:Uncharacterized protein n=1 Tax=Vanilla planifolia TaxID=51239 RepID=A0A835R1N8_VANPL|nr:hypothetical protein HPP92_010155 [Vanilla planifolia]KAG0481978.1 hypothetical protein HPP92_010062 [Vanilla planifolia]